MRVVANHDRWCAYRRVEIRQTPRGGLQHGGLLMHGQELFGHVRARKRPEAGAAAAAEDDRCNHGLIFAWVWVKPPVAIRHEDAYPPSGHNAAMPHRKHYPRAIVLMLLGLSLLCLDACGK